MAKVDSLVLLMHHDPDQPKEMHPYIITQVILAVWLVLAYDPLEDRCMIDIIITKVFPLCSFKMVESFENLDNILCDWAKDRVQKSIDEALNRFKKQ